MIMTMSQSQRMVQRQTLHQRLTLEQRQKIHAYQLSLRIALVADLRDEHYTPRGTCPACGTVLKPEKIISGFNQDPKDFTTACPNCSHRFEPILICFGDGSHIEMPFYCDVQALDMLQSMASQSPEHICKEMPSAYRSAIIHFGSLKNAFASIGVAYDFQDIHSWEAKIIPYLGRMTDKMIAECVESTVGKIRALRKQHGVAAYSKRKLLGELGD